MMQKRCCLCVHDVAASDLAMRALAAELARASEVSGDLARSVLPALAGVEGRLDRLLRN